MKFSLKRHSIISPLATLSYSITVTQVFVTYPPISRCVLHLDRGRCWHTASRLKCLKVYQLSAWDHIQGITYCPGQSSLSPSWCYVGGRYSAKWYQHFWWAITGKDVVSQGISSSEQNADVQICIIILVCMHFFSSGLCYFFQAPTFSLFEEGNCFLRLSAPNPPPGPFQGKLGVIIPYSIM